MRNFGYIRANTLDSIWPLIGQEAGARFLGGGTNLLDLMRENIESPAVLIDVTRALPDAIEELDTGGLRIGGAMRNSHLANDPRIKARYPVLAQALLHGASAQLRNMATTAGNLMQRTRCYYFYDSTGRCNKRSPGSGCDAIAGFNRIHAVLGASPQCIATHPSDMCVALAALDAQIHVLSASGERVIPISEFHRLPGESAHIDTTLQPGELITSVDLPAASPGCRSVYRKVRDRASYAFALVSAAVILELDNQRIRNLRIALGGVAHKPWRAVRAEAMLNGQIAGRALFERAMDAELAEAKGYRDNAFKIPLARRTVVGALTELTQGVWR